MSVQRPARTLRVLAVVMVACAACATQGSGFGVALTIGADDTVSDDAIASITELLITASGDEKGTYTAMINHTFTRHEALIYRPLPSTRSLTLTIEALDIDQTRVASGTTAALTLKAGATTDAGVILMGNASAGSDGGDDGDGFVVNGPDAADLAMPADMAIDIADAGTVPPGAPTGLTMVEQEANAISLSWTAAKAGSVPVAHYNIYRNGAALPTSMTTTFTDDKATNATSPTFSGPATIYSYQVSAVDVVGREGPKTTQTTLPVYSDGNYFWFDDFSFDGSDDFTDTTGDPPAGTKDVSFNLMDAYGGWQPVAGAPSVPKWDAELGAFDHLSLALKPTQANQSWTIIFESDMPDGKGYLSQQVTVEGYGPKPTAGTWGVYSIPLTACGLGSSTFVASISGTTMTVTKAMSGVGIAPGGYVTGPGVMPGTFISAGAAGGPGTYTISPSQTVASTTMTEQHTSIWFFGLQDNTGGNTNEFYIDDVKFTGP